MFSFVQCLIKTDMTDCGSWFYHVGGVDRGIVLIYLSVGDAFDSNAYFDSADKEGELTVQSNVNTAKAGSYYVDYIVNAGAISGKSRLVVVVQ